MLPDRISNWGRGMQNYSHTSYLAIDQAEPIQLDYDFHDVLKQSEATSQNGMPPRCL